MSLRIFSEHFFSNYIFHPYSKELLLKDQRKALIGGIFFGIFTLGVCHLVCLIKYRNRTFNLAAINNSATRKAQIVTDSHVTDFKKANQQKFKPIDTGSLEQKAAKDVGNPKEEILDTLTKSAKKEEDAFLIDFSKVNPSNIFKIFNKGSSFSKTYGDVAISDEISYDESDKFTQNFPFKYEISIVVLEKNEHGYNTSSNGMFTMNDEGRVESYGKVFDNFNDYIEYKMNPTYYYQRCTFQHFDFHSPLTSGEYKTLRKKPSTVNSN